MALVDELAWFEGQALGRGLILDRPALPATTAYAELLERLDHADFAVAIASLWAIERVYLDAWSYAAPGAPQYREFLEHWTTPEFGGYVAALEAVADASGGQDGPVSAVVAEVLEAEVRFWDLAWPGKAR